MNQKKHVKDFIAIIDKHTSMLKYENHFEIAGSLLDDIGYTGLLQREKTPESDGRLENLKKLITDLKNRNSIEEKIIYLKS